MAVLIGKALKWGNSYALRISRRDFERLGLHEGQEIVVDLDPGRRPVEVTWTTFSGDGRSMAEAHDEELYGWPSDA